MTAGQLEVLHALAPKPETATDVAYRVLGYPWSYGSVHSCLRRLEDRGLVRRTGDKRLTGQIWELTHAGRAALQLTG